MAGSIAATLCLAMVQLAVASGHQATKPDPLKPVFMASYCHEVTDPYQSLEFAAWKNGRVIWRVGPTGRGRDGWLKGQYLEGQISPEKVSAAVKQFSRAKLLGELYLESWPTASPRRLEINSMGVQSRFQLDRHKFSDKVSIKAQKLWNRVQGSLTPKSGRSIPAPDSSKWWVAAQWEITAAQRKKLIDRIETARVCGWDWEVCRYQNDVYSIEVWAANDPSVTVLGMPNYIYKDGSQTCVLPTRAKNAQVLSRTEVIVLLARD